MGPHSHSDSHSAALFFCLLLYLFILFIHPYLFASPLYDFMMFVQFYFLLLITVEISIMNEDHHWEMLSLNPCFANKKKCVNITQSETDPSITKGNFFLF